MQNQIIVQNEYTIDPIILEEEAYNKTYYLQHPNSSLDLLCTQDKIQPLIENPNAPYKKDNTYRMPLIFNNKINDNILNYYQTNIYAHIPPNYIPAVLHGHTYFEIVYVLSGSCTNYSGNQVLTLQEGDFLIIAPNTSHAISSFNDTCRIVNIMIRSSIFQKTFFSHFTENDILYSFFHNVLFNYKTNTYLLFNSFQDSLLKALVINLLDEIKHRHSYQEQAKEAYIQLLFARLLNRHSGHSVIYNDGVNNCNHDITLILSYMQEHFQTLKLSDLSSFFGYSERQLSRILLAYTNKNYQENILEIKMRKAVQLLLETDYSIEKISEIIGYSTSFGFRKNFKRFFKVTPLEYRSRRFHN